MSSNIYAVLTLLPFSYYNFLKVTIFLCLGLYLSPPHSLNIKFKSYSKLPSQSKTVIPSTV